MWPLKHNKHKRMRKVVFFIVLIAAITITYLYPETMINPGELVDAHQNLSNNCTACHQPFGGIPNDKCIACHTVSEIGKDTSNYSGSITNGKKVLFHQNLTDQNCIACHTDHKGKDPQLSLGKFEHTLLTKSVANNCISCHETPTNELHKQLSTDCIKCHNTNEWKFTARFNHDMIISADKNNCVSCHQSPKDSFHDMSGSNCMECHSTNKWVPSTFDHTSYFVFDKHHTTNCSTCHTNNDFKAYTCYGCHEHSESNIRGEHLEEGIQNFQDCVRCHKSGNEHDIIRANGINNPKERTTNKEHGKHDDDDDD